MTRNLKVAQGLILAAWAVFLLALWLPAIDVKILSMRPDATLFGFQAAFGSFALIGGFLAAPSLRSAWYLLLPAANVVLLFCPLELFVHHKLRRLAGPIVALSLLGLVCVVLLPILGDLVFSGQHSGHFLLQAALGLLAVGNIVLFRSGVTEHLSS